MEAGLMKLFTLLTLRGKVALQRPDKKIHSQTVEEIKCFHLLNSLQNLKVPVCRSSASVKYIYIYI